LEISEKNDFRNFRTFGKPCFRNFQTFSKLCPIFFRTFWSKNRFFWLKNSNFTYFFWNFRNLRTFSNNFRTFFRTFSQKFCEFKNSVFFRKISELRKLNFSETRKNKKFWKFRLTQGLMWYVLCRLFSNYFTHVIHIVLSRNKLKSNQINVIYVSQTNILIRTQSSDYWIR